MSRLFFASLFAVALLFAGCASESTETANVPAAESEDAPAADNSTTDYLDDLVITDLVEGDGPMVQAGQRAVVHYTLWFRDASAENGRGRQVQSSKERNQPFGFTIGRGEVIDGWDQGVPGMKVGGTRELQVPYRLAYKEAGRTGIPQRQDLIFEIELLEIQ
jgi:FKBP-type peptidyl-prolyl cis-trans isomerase